MKRFAQRAAWGIADFLTMCPQSEGVTWWTAALLRFATTGETVTVTMIEKPLPVAAEDWNRWINPKFHRATRHLRRLCLIVLGPPGRIAPPPQRSSKIKCKSTKTIMRARTRRVHPSIALPRRSAGDK